MNWDSFGFPLILSPLRRKLIFYMKTHTHPLCAFPPLMVPPCTGHFAMPPCMWPPTSTMSSIEQVLTTSINLVSICWELSICEVLNQWQEWIRHVLELLRIKHTANPQFHYCVTRRWADMFDRCWSPEWHSVLDLIHPLIWYAYPFQGIVPCTLNPSNKKAQWN